MNKILLDEEVFVLDNHDYSIEVKGVSKIYITPEINNYNLSIILKDNASLEMYIYTKNNNKNSINITSCNNTTLKVIHSFDIQDSYTFNFKNNVIGNNNVSNVLIKGIARGTVQLNIDGIVNNETKENELNEKINVLTRGGKVISSPMLHVSTKNVLANHGNSISNIDENVLFYLMSKGIGKAKAIKLIEDSYVFGVFKDNEDFKKLIN